METGRRRKRVRYRGFMIGDNRREWFLYNRAIAWIILCLLITFSSVMPVFFLPAPVRSTSNQIQLTSGNSNDLYPNLSPSGQNIVFARNQSGATSIWIMNSQGMHQSRLTYIGGQQTHPAFNPSGSEIAFLSSSQNNGTSLWVIKPNSQGIKDLGEFGVIGSFQWNSAGNRIALDSFQNGFWNIWVVDVSTGGMTLLVNGSVAGNTSNNIDPSWSSNGNLIYFSSNRSGGDYRIWSIDTVSGDLVQLSHGPGNDTKPSSSPSGEYIAYVSDYQGLSYLSLMDSNGSDEHVALSNPLDQLAPGVQYMPEVSPDSFPTWNSLSGAVLFFSENTHPGDSTNANVFGYYLNTTVDYYQNQLQSSTSGLVVQSGSSVVPLIYGLSDRFPSWGPGGTEIVYSSVNSLGHSAIWLMLLGGATPHVPYG